MNDFERNISARLPSIQNRQQQEAAASAALDQQRRDEVARAAQEAQRVKNIGMQFVQLLERYQVASEPVWERRVVGRRWATSQSKSGTISREVDKLAYVRIGHGWLVYDRIVADSESFEFSHDRIAIDNHGGTFTVESGNLWVDLNNPIDKRIHQGLGVNRRDEPIRANGRFNEDAFKDGIAMLISGRGPYVDV